MQTSQKAGHAANGKFLEAVARYYIDRPLSTDGLCIVFPNKRSAIFFRRYLKLNAKGAFLMPHLTTIGAFEASLLEDTECCTDRIELTMMLYGAYHKVCNNHGLKPMSFDRFAYWGELMLSDFDDIDASLAQASDLYVNLVRYNEISSNYLTDEQLAVVREIWGDERAGALAEGADSSFWRHIRDAAENPDNGGGARRFVRLWQIMGEVYAQFGRVLSSKQMCYPGLASRKVAERICNHGITRYRHIAFVGFNALSIARAKYMAKLRARGQASFFWDILPDPQHAPYAQRTYQGLKRLAGILKMPGDFTIPPFKAPQINVMGVPSNFLQAKVAAKILSKWLAQGDIDFRRPDNTAVIVPDANLLTPVLQSLPESAGGNPMGEVNITMGLSFKQTPFAALMRAIVSLHMRRRKIRGQLHFFRDDLLKLINHPHLRTLANQATAAIRDVIEKNRQYNIAATALSTEGAQALQPLFADVDPFDVSEVRQYMTGVLQTLKWLIESTGEKINVESHEIRILEAYDRALDRIFDALQRYRISDIGEGTIFGLLERILSTHTLNMNGTPLSGLQVMGVLETRSLDFDNVVVLSMNERIFPRRQRLRSLIPQQLRRAYGLPTASDEDDQYAYFFYRLLSRSKRICCLYDSRSAGLASGAMSRYLMQLRYMSANNKPQNGWFVLTPGKTDQRRIVIAKTPQVLDELQRLKSTDPAVARNLSATALKCYRSCGIKFFLDYVHGVRSDNDVVDYMDAATYGSILHGVLEDLFNARRIPGSDKNPLITADSLKTMIADYGALCGRVYRKIDSIYHRGKFKADTTLMPSESLLLGEMMADFIVKVIEKDIDSVNKEGPFEFLGAEYLVQSVRPGQPVRQWQATPRHTVNVRMEIDRFDRLADGTLRMVDYKTGQDKHRANSIENLFSDDNENARDAIFQLMFYAMVYSDITGCDALIKPSLYRISKAFDINAALGDQFENDAVFIDGKPVRFSNDLSKLEPSMQKTVNDFRTKINQTIEDIFDPDKPFVQATTDNNCRYCHYLTLCRRFSTEN